MANKYRVERLLGEGGMGVVLAARNELLDQPVAVKLLRPGRLADATARKRFEREARSAAKIQSDHVARVFDVGELPDGDLYLVMELLVGADLAEIVARGPLSLADAVDAVIEACDAVAEAHALGIVHRDLKPANLFRARLSDGTVRIKVLDFGISKRIEGVAANTGGYQLTDTAQVLGSPLYMAPEQLAGSAQVDRRTDVWALGVVLFELLTGRSPFLADTLPQIFVAILERPSPRVRELRAEVPPALDDIIARCLDKRPDARFENAARLSAALAPFGTEASRRAAERARRFDTGSIVPIAIEPPVTRPQATAASAPAPEERTAQMTTPAAPLRASTTAGLSVKVPRRSRTPWIAGGAIVLAAAGAVAAIAIARRGSPIAPVSPSAIAPPIASTSPPASAAREVEPAVSDRAGAQDATPPAPPAAAAPQVTAQPSAAPPPVSHPPAAKSAPASRAPPPAPPAPPLAPPPSRPAAPDFSRPD